jgi:hypothetical protein
MKSPVEAEGAVAKSEDLQVSTRRSTTEQKCERYAEIPRAILREITGVRERRQ